jgi:hypothetical protein
MGLLLAEKINGPVFVWHRWGHQFFNNVFAPVIRKGVEFFHFNEENQSSVERVYCCDVLSDIFNFHPEIDVKLIPNNAWFPLDKTNVLHNHERSFTFNERPILKEENSESDKPNKDQGARPIADHLGPLCYFLIGIRCLVGGWIIVGRALRCANWIACFGFLLFALGIVLQGIYLLLLTSLNRRSENDVMRRATP